MEVVDLALSLVPLALFAAHAPTAAVVGAAIVWAVSFTIALPALLRSCVVCWRAGTRAKWQARILRAHAAEVRELAALLREEVTR